MSSPSSTMRWKRNLPKRFASSIGDRRRRAAGQSAGDLQRRLRKYAEASRRAMTRVPLDIALRDAGVPPFVLRSAETRLRTLSDERAENSIERR